MLMADDTVIVFPEWGGEFKGRRRPVAKAPPCGHYRLLASGVYATMSTATMPSYAGSECEGTDLWDPNRRKFPATCRGL